MDTLLLGVGVVGVVAVAVVGLASLEVLLRRPEAGVALALGVTVIQAALVENVPSLTLPGGISVKLHDIVFALLLLAGIARFLRFRRLTALERLLLLLGFMLLLSLVRGILMFGQQGVSEFRLFSPFISTAIYFASFPPSSARNDRIGRIWLVLTTPMVVLICSRWVQNLGGINLGVPPEEFGADAALRVVNGPYGFFVATSVMLTVPFWPVGDERARKLRWVGGLLLLIVVLLNRRTVWIALLVGVAVVLLRNRKHRHRAVLTMVAVAIVGVGVFVALPEPGTETAVGGTQSTITSPLTTQTFEWRTEGWTKLLEGWSGNPVNWIVGEPFGSGFARSVEGDRVASTSDPHNFFILTLLRTGVIGMLTFIVLVIGLLRVLWRKDPPTSIGLLSSNIFPALLVTQLIWFLTWTPGNEVGIILGLALALASSRVMRRPAVRSPLAIQTTREATAGSPTAGAAPRAVPVAAQVASPAHAAAPGSTLTASPPSGPPPTGPQSGGPASTGPAPPAPPDPPPAPPDPDRRPARRGALIAAVAAALVVVAAALPSAGVWPSRPSAISGEARVGASLVLTKSAVEIGDTYDVIATGFDAGEPIQLSWTGPTAGTMNSDPADGAGGRRHGPVIERDPPGRYQITATGLRSGRTATAPLEVLPALPPTDR